MSTDFWTSNRARKRESLGREHCFGVRACARAQNAAAAPLFFAAPPPPLIDCAPLSAKGRAPTQASYHDSASGRLFCKKR
jgi:hypothetical protein